MNPLDVGLIPPSPDLVTQFYNDSTGKGDNGEADIRGPCNSDEVGDEVVTGFLDFAKNII